MTFPLACRRLRADVAFVPYWGSPWWQPCPVVVTVHDLIPLLLPLYRGGMLQRAYTALVSRTARRAAAVLTDSEASKRTSLRGWASPSSAFMRSIWQPIRVIGPSPIPTIWRASVRSTICQRRRFCFISVGWMRGRMWGG